eukprot:1473793-Rhodomonas_salina.1
MPFSTYLTAHSVPLTSSIDILVSTQHLDAERSKSTECFAAELSLAAARRQQLFSMIRKDPSLANDALPFWPPLFSLTQLSEITMEIAGEGEQIRDDNDWGRNFLAAAGMNPELPWDEWYDEMTHHDFDNSVGNQMSKEEQHWLLLTSFEARVLAETADYKDEVWRELKQRWGGHKKHAPHGCLAISSIFDLVEAELKGRLLAAGGSTAVAEQTLDEQIFEIMGQTLLDPNQALWMRDGIPKVDSSNQGL